MLRSKGLALLLGAALFVSGWVSAQQPPSIVPVDPPPGGSDAFGSDWPDGEGRMLTGAACITCHSLAIVKQQGLSRKRWDELLDWMVEEQGMPEYDENTRTVILDYLERHFGIESRVSKS
jgi:cytochrome c